MGCLGSLAVVMTMALQAVAEPVGLEPLPPPEQEQPGNAEIPEMLDQDAPDEEADAEADGEDLDDIGEEGIDPGPHDEVPGESVPAPEAETGTGGLLGMAQAVKDGALRLVPFWFPEQLNPRLERQKWTLVVLGMLLQLSPLGLTIPAAWLPLFLVAPRPELRPLSLLLVTLQYAAMRVALYVVTYVMSYNIYPVAVIVSLGGTVASYVLLWSYQHAMLRAWSDILDKQDARVRGSSSPARAASLDTPGGFAAALSGLAVMSVLSHDGAYFAFMMGLFALGVSLHPYVAVIGLALMVIYPPLVLALAAFVATVYLAMVGVLTAAFASAGAVVAGPVAWLLSSAGMQRRVPLVPVLLASTLPTLAWLAAWFPTWAAGVAVGGVALLAAALALVPQFIYALYLPQLHVRPPARIVGRAAVAAGPAWAALTGVHLVTLLAAQAVSVGALYVVGSRLGRDTVPGEGRWNLDLLTVPAATAVE